ncbi:MAG: hypothetical protein IJ094_12945 [Bacilli bacterium]|nr:hypothetical protein [Bacilli bacterium]
MKLNDLLKIMDKKMSFDVYDTEKYLLYPFLNLDNEIISFIKDRNIKNIKQGEIYVSEIKRSYKGNIIIEI